MKRIYVGVLLCMSTATVLAQTNCQVMAGGLIRCSDPQTLTSPTPSTSNCTYVNGMMRCTQPQGIQQAMPVPPQSQPNYIPPNQYAQSSHYGGSPATSFMQGYMKGRQQAQQRAEQQEFQQERLEQVRLQNQLLQQQLDMQRQQAQVPVQQQPAQDQHRQGPVQPQPMSAADQQTVDEEQRRLEQDVANGH
jgi:hypothetical protein